MSQKKTLTQADKPEALTAAELAMRLAKQPEQAGLLKGKQQQVLIEDEDEQSEKIAESADDSEVLAAVEPGSAGANGAANVHLAEVAGAPASDAPPSAAGSVSTGAAAGATAMGELGTGLLIAGGVIAVAAAAGGGGGGDGTAPAGDTTPPVILSMAAHSGTAGNATIVLTYDGALDAAHPPVAANFAVSASGVANPVANVAINGSTVTLTLTNALAAGPITITYTDPTAGNDVNAIQDAAGNDAVSFTSGIVADGYVRGAEVYIDSNANGVADPATDYHVGTTDSNGNFILPAGAPSGVLIAVGGVNIDTGVPNTVPLLAPAGSTTINPLTTLVQAMITATPGTSAAAASASVVSALGLTAGTDLTRFDPLSSSDLAAQIAAAQVATMLTLAENDNAGAAATITSNLADQIKTANTNSATLDLSDTSTLTTALNGSGVSGTAQTAIASATTAIKNATTLDEISDAQSQSLDTTTPAAPTAAPDLLATSDTGASNTDDLTQATTPSLRVSFNTAALDGTAAVAGDTVIIKDGGTQVGSAILIASDIAAGYKDIATSTTLAEGSRTLSAQITDQAGHTSATSTSLAITVDTTPPTLAISSNVGAVKGGETATITFTFSEAPSDFAAGDVVTAGGSLSGLAVTADPKVYTATFTPTPNIASGTASITVAGGTYTDAAGNAGGAGTTPAISIDTLAPTVGISSDVAAVKIGETANVTFTFSEDPGASFAWDGSVGDVVVSGGTLSAISGTGLTRTATFTPATDFEGNASITLAAGAYTDAAGNAGGAGTTPALAIDTLAPTLVITSNDSALKIGETATITFTFSSTPTDFAAGDVATSGGSLSNLAVTADPKVYTATFTPTTDFEGSASISVAGATYTDAAGNTGGAGATPAITVDTLAPTATATITGADDNVPATSTVNIAPDSTTNDNTPTLKGTITGSLGSGEVVAVYDGATRLGAANVDGSNWSLTTASLGNGAHSFSVRVEDAAGNQGAASAAYAFSIDATVPTATAPITGLTDAVAMVTGNIANGGVSNDPAPVLSGTITGALAGGDIVRVYDGATLLGDATVNGATWNFSTTLLPGAHSFTTLVENAGGNQGVASNAYGVTLDFTSPAAPTLALTTDTGSSNSDKITSNGALTATGVESGASVEYSTDGSTWSGAFTPVSGSNTVYARQIDVAGNASPASNAFTFTFDNTAPAAPSLVLSSDTGSSNVDKITSNGALTATGVEAGASVEYSSDGSTWSGAFTPVSGSNTAYARQTDVAGNVSPASSAFTFTFDNTAPAAPTLALTTDTGSSNSDKVTSNGALTATGLEQGATLEYSTNGGTTWSSTLTPVAGNNAVQARQTDVAGNPSPASDTFSFTFDNTAPSFTSPASAVFPNQGTDTAYTAVASDASAFSYSLTGADAGLFDIDANRGAVTFKTAPSTAVPADSGGDNVYNFDVTATDLAGMSSSKAVAISVVNAPSLQASALDNVTNFEVTSNIVLNYSENIVAVAGKYIHIVNDGGTGFRVESTAHTQDILVTDATQVSIVGGKVTLNPTFDLDLANTYHITIDAGAFTGESSHLATAAYDGTTSLNFATVTPGTSSLANAAQSQAMDAAGALVNGHQWLDIEGIGNASNASSAPVDLLPGSYALVAKDYDPAGTNLDAGYLGVRGGEFWVGANNFGADDLIYFDDQGNNPNAINDLSLIGFGNGGTAPSTLVLGSTGTGAVIDITVAGSTAAFDDIAALIAALQLSVSPIISA